MASFVEEKTVQEMYHKSMGIK